MEERKKQANDKEKDSVFASGISMMAQKMPSEIKSIDYTGRAFEALQYLAEAGALTTSALSNLLKCNRSLSARTLRSLWHASLVKWVTVATNLSIFKLWLPAESKLPKNANEACRMAVLGLYYSLAKHEVPGFEWRLVRNKNKVLIAEKYFNAKGQPEKAKMIIDVPRRREWPDEGASLFILPTFDEANQLVQKGSRFTTDIYLSKRDKVALNTKIFEKVDSF